MPANSRWDLIQRLYNLNDPDRPQCVKLYSHNKTNEIKKRTNVLGTKREQGT